MKINLKKRVMLAVLAGGMLCANGAFADYSLPLIYGKTGGAEWASGYIDAEGMMTGLVTPIIAADSAGTPVTDYCTTGANLSLVEGVDYGSAQAFIAGYGYNPAAATTVSGNTLTVRGGDGLEGMIYAAGAAEGMSGDTVKGNTLIMESGTCQFYAFGGVSLQGDASNTVSGNTVIIKGGKFDPIMYNCQISGGFSMGAANVSGNIVKVSGGEFDNAEIDGGASQGAANANYNSVEIAGGNFTGSMAMISGGFTNAGNMKGNKVKLSGGNFEGLTDQLMVAGSISMADVGWVDISQDINTVAEDNEVSITAGSYSAAQIMGASNSYTIKYNSDVTGGSYTITVKNNAVKIANGSFSDVTMIIGGVAGVSLHVNDDATDETVNVTAEGNRVEIEGGSFTESMIAGGAVMNMLSFTGSIADDTENTVVKKNIVTIKNGAFEAVQIVGGMDLGAIMGGDPCESHIGGATGDGNIVNIEDGTFVGAQIYGGGGFVAEGNEVNISGGFFGEYSGVVGGQAAVEDISSNAINNTVNIRGGSFANGFMLMGGMAMPGTSSGNTLNLQTVINGTVQSAGYFQQVNFTIPAGATADDVMMRMASTFDCADVDFSTDLNGLTLGANDYITLIRKVNDTNCNLDADGQIISQPKHYVLEIGGVKELVYAPNGMPFAKKDYTIKQGSNKFDSGSIAGTYDSEVKGNTTDGGLSDTSYSGNEVIIRRGTYNDGVYGANCSGNNDVTGNKVTVYDGTINNVYGGWTDEGNANGNELTIKGGKFYSDSEIVHIYAGHTSDGSTANNNRLTINGGYFCSSDESVLIRSGSAGGAGSVEGNTLKFTGGTFEGAGNLYAGYSDSGNVKGNNTIISGGRFPDFNFFGGYSASGDVGGTADSDANTVTITNGAFDSIKVYGGKTTDNGNVTGNKVVVSGGMIGSYSNIYGGYSENGNANENKVEVKGGTFGEGSYIYGGYSYSGNAEGNSVIIKDGTFKNGCNILGCLGVGNAKGNSVTIEGGTFGNLANLTGGQSTSYSSTNNTLNLRIKMSGTHGCVDWFQNMNFTLPSNITNGDVMLKTDCLAVDYRGGTATVNVYAGEGMELDVGTVITLVDVSTGSISDNYIVGTIFGVDATLGDPGVYSTNTAKVTIDSTDTKTIKLTMLDFYSDTWYGTTAGGFTRKKAEAVAEGGILNVDGADTSFAGTKFFYGGYSNGEGIEVKNNTVKVTGGEFGPGKDIYGGYSESGPANSNTVNIEGGTFNDGYKLYGGVGTASSGNTLNLKIKMGGKAAEVGCFQIMNFTLPSEMQNGDVMLKAETVTFDNTKISVDATNAVKLKTGDVITLIDADNVQGAWEAGEIVGAAGAIAQDSNKLTFTIGGGGHDDDEDKDKDKAPVEGIAAAVQTVNMSADLASGEGMKSLVAETVGGVTNTFGALSKGQSKYKTGSHVDVDGWGVIVGAGKTKEWKDGSTTTYGLFFEYGKGDFDTYNGDVHGDGNSENKGVGIMARHKLTNNTYYEGNIRYGKQETEWGQSDIGSYDTDSRYYGISVGVGHIYPVGKNEIDFYGRYTYGHVGTCDATVGTSEYHFDSVKSHRVRVGGKYNFKQKNSNAKPYVGLAWEHEFKGEAKASISGVGEAPAPSMKGNTGILEVGCDWNVSKKWTLGLGANAYMGKRKGWDGMARVFYNF